MPYKCVFSKFRNFKPHKLGLSKSLKLKTVSCSSLQLIHFARVCFKKEKKNSNVIRGQCPLEGEGMEVGTSKYFPVTYFNL